MLDDPSAEEPDQSVLSSSDSNSSGLLSQDDPTTRSSKNKRRNRKKKKKKPSVSFGTTSVIEFERCLGADVVPGDGGWPLGMNWTVVEEYSAGVDAYEADKQERLRQRWRLRKSTMLKQDLVNFHFGDSLEGVILETRAYDYKDGHKNPLFGMLCEQDRMKLLLKSSTPPSSFSEDEPVIHDRKLRSTRSRSASFSEQFNDTFTQAHVHHVRHELEQIRNWRTAEDARGCTCRKLQVYLPPPDGGGKKAQKRRMNPNKVKDELKKRGLLPKEDKTREELEVLLYEAVEAEPCCLDDCSCVVNGIDCQDNACQCWRPSHQTSSQKRSSESDSSPSAIQRRCGNPHGMTAVDFGKINAYRQEMICQVIQPQ